MQLGAAQIALYASPSTLFSIRFQRGCSRWGRPSGNSLGRQGSGEFATAGVSLSRAVVKAHRFDQVLGHTSFDHLNLGNFILDNVELISSKFVPRFSSRGPYLDVSFPNWGNVITGDTWLAAWA